MKIFLAGATGVIGRNLVPLLKDAGHAVTGTTRTSDGAAKLAALGIGSAVVDVFDLAALKRAVISAAPDVIVHQLTDLSGGTDSESLARNARLRREGTANLMAAARAAGVGRIIAQSIAWAYAPKAPPYFEADPLDLGAEGSRGVSIRDGVVPLENAVLQQTDLTCLILRYGQLYGPGTWTELPEGTSPVHVEAAAYAAALAVDRGPLGAYNVAEPDGEVAIDKAVRELGWNPEFRRPRQEQNA